MKHKFIYIVLTIFLVYCETSTAQTVSKNLSLGDYVSYQALYNGQTIDSTVFTIADIASWKDTRYGKEYALICLPASGTGSGVAMVEVTDPGNAVYKKTIRYPDPLNQGLNAAFDVKVYNDILFVAQEDQSAHPTYWVELEDAVDNLGSSTAGVHTGDLTAGIDIHNMFINKDHELLFLSNFEEDEDIQVYDISGLPGSSPSLVGTIPMEQTGVDMRSHDLYAMETSTGYGRVFDANLVSVTVTDYTWNGTTFSVSSQLSHEFNPKRGQSPGNFNNAFTQERFRNVHSTWIGEDTDYLFTTVEGFQGSNNYSTTWVDPNSDDYQRANYLSVWDINPINPSADGNGYRYPIEEVYEVRENASSGSTASSYFSTLSSEKANSIHNITTRGDAYGDTAFVSYYSKGIRVLDVTNPASLSEIAYYDVSGFVTYWKPVFNGTFGVDPFLPSGIVLGSSSEGLYVFRKPGNFAGSIQVNTLWTGTIKVTGDVTVAGGATLTIDPGATIQFSNNSQLVVNGTLDVNGTSGSPVSFDFLSASSGNGIILNPGSEANIEYAEIENAWYGIYIQQNDASVANCTIHDSEYGIYLYNTDSYSGTSYSNGIGIENNELYDNASGSIVLSGSSPVITGNTIYNSYIGVYCINYSSPYLGAAGVYGDNKIYDNDCGIYCYNYSDPFLGRSTCTIQGGNNSIKSNDVWDAFLTTNCYVVAENNYWGASTPDSTSQFSVASGCTLDYRPYLSTDPMAKMVASGGGSPEEELFDAEITGNNGENTKEYNYNEKWPILWKLHYARNLIMVKDYKFAYEITKQVIEDNPDSSLSSYALSLMTRAGRSYDYNRFADDLEKIAGVRDQNEIRSAAAVHLLKFLDVSKRKNMFKEILNRFSDKNVVEAVLLQEFLTAFHDRKDRESARNVLKELDSYSQKSGAAVAAHLVMGDNVSEFFMKKNSEENTSLLTADRFDLLGNYPNPFNPETTIKYMLPDIADVKITIYDVMGREIFSVIKPMQADGYHQLTWNGVNNNGEPVSSGIYIYRLDVQSREKDYSTYTASSKLMLLK